MADVIGSLNTITSAPAGTEAGLVCRPIVSGTQTVDTELPAAAALADGAANPTAPTVGGAVLMFNGTTWDRQRGDTTNGLDVDVTRLPALVTGSATIGAVNLAQYTPVAGRVPVDGSGVTQPVSGTVTANAGSGTFVVGDGGLTLSVDDGAGSLTVDGTVSVSGAVDTELPVAGALADAASNPTTPTVGAAVLLFNGTTWDRQRGDTANGLDVDVTRLPALVAGSATIGAVNLAQYTPVAGRLPVDGSGVTQPVSGTVTANAGSGTFPIDGTVDGDVAHDGVDSGNPVKIGGKAVTTLPAGISATGDRVDAYFDKHGHQYVRLANQAQTIWTAIHVPAANTTATATKAAAGVNIKNVCTTLTVVLAATATAPTAVNLQVNLIDGAAGGTTYLWRTTISLPATAGAMNGVALSGLWFPGTANTAMTLEFSAAGGANTIESVTMSGTTINDA